MEKSDQVLACIFEAMDEVVGLHPQYGPLEKAPDTPLFGSASRLDSLGLVNLIVAVEERLHKTLGVSLTLADERAMSRRQSPFRTVSSLAEYIDERMGA